MERRFAVAGKNRNYRRRLKQIIVTQRAQLTRQNSGIFAATLHALGFLFDNAQRFKSSSHGGRVEAGRVDEATRGADPNSR